MDYTKLVNYCIQMFSPLESVLRLICSTHVFRVTVILPSRINLHFSIYLFLVGIPIKVLVGYFVSLLQYAYKIVSKKLCALQLLLTKLP
jgi:hypothetical protein